MESFALSQSHLDFSIATAVCIGDQTAQSALKYGFKVVEADESSIGSLINKIVELANKKDKSKI